MMLVMMIMSNIIFIIVIIIIIVVAIIITIVIVIIIIISIIIIIMMIMITIIMWRHFSFSLWASFLMLWLADAGLEGYTNRACKGNALCQVHGPTPLQLLVIAMHRRGLPKMMRRRASQHRRPSPNRLALRTVGFRVPRLADYSSRLVTSLGVPPSCSSRRDIDAFATHGLAWLGRPCVLLFRVVKHPGPKPQDFRQGQ